MAALQVVAETAEVVIDGCVGIVVAVDAPVGDDVEPRVFLVERDGADRVLKGLPVHGVRRLLIAGEMAPPRGIPPAGIRIISHHAGGNRDFFTSDDHSTSLRYNEGLDAPSVISGRLTLSILSIPCQTLSYLSVMDVSVDHQMEDIGGLRAGSRSLSGDHRPGLRLPAKGPRDRANAAVRASGGHHEDARDLLRFRIELFRLGAEDRLSPNSAWHLAQRAEREPQFSDYGSALLLAARSSRRSSHRE